MEFIDLDFYFLLLVSRCCISLTSSYIYINIPFKFQYLFLIKSHLQSYPCPNNINTFWNIGFLLGISIVMQLITGILLSLHYTPHINYSYYSIMYIIRDVYYGWSLRYIHSNGASFLFTVLFIHIGRGLYYGNMDAASYNLNYLCYAPYKPLREFIQVIGTCPLIVQEYTRFASFHLS